MARYLGIDFGEKRVGIAITDPTRTIAQPFKTIHYTSLKKLVTEIKAILAEKEVAKIILGLPLSMKGADSAQTQVVRDFADRLRNSCHVPVELLDERLTTVQAHQVMHQMGKKPSRHRDKVDQIAAQYILQTYIDREKTRGLK